MNEEENLEETNKQLPKWIQLLKKLENKEDTS